MSYSRTKNSFFIMSTGFIQQVLATIFGFITRTVFIKTIGIEYLGINGLFTNILSIISLAELGVGTAITFYMYKPLADNDIEELKAIINFYRKCYRIIGFVIICLGLCVIPFLHRMVKIDSSLNVNIYVIYLLFLMNSAVSYLLFAYRSTIIFADQKGYMLNTINSVFIIIGGIIEISILVLFKNFTLSLLSKVVLSILVNIAISIKAGRIYPFINEKNNNKLKKGKINSIMVNVYSIFIFRLSSKLFESTNNIVISAFIGTIYVGYNSNYLLIIGSIVGILNIIRGSFIASVGNVNAAENVETKYMIFKNLDFFNFWMTSFCAVCFFQLLNPFITLWIGKEYLFSTSTVAVIVINFLTSSLLNIVFMFREAMGLFKYGRYRQLFGGVINIVLSIILAKQYGVFGVFLSTLICGLLITIFPFPKIVYKYGFNKDHKEYVLRYFAYLCITVMSCIIVFISCSIFRELNWLTFIGQMLFCLIIPNILYILMFRKTDEYKWIKNKLFIIILDIKDKISHLY